MASLELETNDSSPVLPIGNGDIKVDFPSGRDPRLPNVYIMKPHPQHSGGGKAYYFVHDGTREGSEKIYKMEVEDLRIPQGPRDDALAMGFLELLPGDIIFSRLGTDPVSGLEDVPVAWVTGDDIYSNDLRERALRVRNDVLGKSAERSGDFPERNKDTGIFEGGTAWERSLKGNFKKKRGRCYPFGCTFQKARSLYSPCAAGKHSIVDDETLKMRTDLANVLTEMAILSLKKGPVQIVDAIRLNHDLFNTPRVGSPDNFAFTSNQLNLAHMKEWDSDESLADNMGRKFGGAHIDQLDSPGHFTNMIALSDLPDGSDPGRFFIPYPGVFCTLDNFVSVNFSGLRVHGGSPPIAHKDAVLSDEKRKAATRFTGVCYAKIGPTSSERKMPLFQIETDKILSITPEMLRPGDVKLPRTFNSTNFITEGPSVMSSSSMMEFIARCFLLLIFSLVYQLPASLDVQVDTDSFLGSFHYVDETGARKNVGPWDDGPGWRSRAVDRAGVESNVRWDLQSQKEHRDLQFKTWKEHENKCGAHILSAVCCLPGIKPLQGWSEGDTLLKIKPLLFNKGKNVEESSSEEEMPEPEASPAKKKKKRNSRKKRAFAADASSKRHQRSSAGVTSAAIAKGGESLSNSNTQTGRRLVPYVLVPSMPGSYYEDEDVPDDLSDGTESDSSEYSPGESLSALESSGESTPVGESVNRSPLSSTMVSLKTRHSVYRGPTTPTPLFTGIADSTSHKSYSGLLHGDLDDADDATADVINSVPLPAPDLTMKDEDIVVKSLSESRAVSKRLRSDDNEALVGPDPPLNGEDVPRSKRRHIGLNKIWASDGYRQLEIHITECEPINVAYSVASESVLPMAAMSSPSSTSSEDIISDDDLVDEVKNLRDLPRYLQGLTSDLVHGEYVMVEETIVSLAGYRNAFDMVQTVNSLTSLHDRVREAPLELSSLTSVRNAWQGMEYLSRSEQVNTIRLKKIRACIMLTSSIAWRWLLVSIPQAIRNIQYQTDAQCEWLGDLMWALKQALFMRRKNAKFSTNQFFWPLDQVRPAFVDFNDLVIPGDQDHESWITFYTETITHILQVWLNYPTGESRAQGIFAFNLIRTIGPEFLLLDFVWARFQSANHQLIRSSSLPEELNRSGYPLLSPDSTLHQDIRRISILIDDYISGRLYRYLDFDAQTNTYIDHISRGMIDISVQRINTFKRFLSDCFAMLFRGEKISNKKLKDSLKNYPDKFSPFREHAPSRVHVCQPGGPFSPEALQTIIGVYGGLLFRGVTFATPFSRKGRILFESPVDFRNAVKECKYVYTEKDYCDPTAYGTANSGRKPALAELYWHQLKLFPWTDGLTATKPIPFNKAYGYFYPSPVKPRFPMLGPLGAYLLTVDYVYAGLVERPSPDELAVLICDLNKGAANALYYLGLLPQKSDTENMAQDQLHRMFVTAFKVADDIVKDSIPRDYHDEAGLDIFVTEHSLCKFIRAYRQCGLSTA